MFNPNSFARERQLHGRRSRGGRGGQVPRIWSGGLSLPPDFVMLQNFKHRITCISM